MGKVGGRNFGKFMVIRQIRECFPSPKFPSIRYKQFLQSNFFMYNINLITSVNPYMQFLCRHMAQLEAISMH